MAAASGQVVRDKAASTVLVAPKSRPPLLRLNGGEDDIPIQDLFSGGGGVGAWCANGSSAGGELPREQELRPLARRIPARGGGDRHLAAGPRRGRAGHGV